MTLMVCLHQAELKLDVLGRQGLVDGCVRLDAGLSGGLVLGVKEDVDAAGTANRVAGLLAGDLDGVHEVLKEVVVDSGQGTAVGTVDTASTAALAGLGEDAALSNKSADAAAELLLELTDKLDLDLLESSEEGDGDKDDGSHLGLRDLDLNSTADVQSLQVAPEGSVLLKVKDGLSDLTLESGDLSTISLLNLPAREHLSQFLDTNGGYKP